jgi:Ala-tRNA(Pro) deacylase
MVHEKGKPQNYEERKEVEQCVYKYLENLEIEFDRVDHEAADNMEVCREIDKVLGASICKNLFLCNRQKTDFYLLMMPDDKPFKTKELSAQINCSRLSFASAEKMQEYLGVYPGSVSVLGLINDKESSVNLIVDEDLLKSEFIGCHPCVNTSSLKIRTDDLFGKFLKSVNHTYRTVRLTGE